MQLLKMSQGNIMSFARGDIITPSTNLQLDTPSKINELRHTISTSHLMNSAHNLHELIDQLFTFVKNRRNTDSASIQDLLESGKEIKIFKGCPWSKYKTLKTLDWTAYDEIVASSISIMQIYYVLTLEALEKQYSSDDLADDVWKKITNILKSAFGLANEIQGQVSKLHRPNFDYIYHLNQILVQLLIIFKNIHVTHREIEVRFGDFEKVPEKLNTYVRILIFVYNECAVLEQLKKSSQVATLKRFVEILFSYYRSLFYYHKNELGIALAINKYGLANSIDQSKIRSKLHIKAVKSNVKDKHLWREEIRFMREFQDSTFPAAFRQNVATVVDILRILNSKYEKLNNSINFQKVPSLEEVRHKYLFDSPDLPSGLQVPLADINRFVPACLVESINVQDVYF
ncbi:hypothetical protein KL949_002315 [Ogataea haglerorum]|nr:hypothetical protein KL913_003040 [Ogataea haglerorum]KAG7719323.1 hypothetical protein KL949_002315 [Ogataea haglerorum]